MIGPTDDELSAIEQQANDIVYDDCFEDDGYGQFDEHAGGFISDEFLGIETEVSVASQSWSNRVRLSREDRQDRTRKDFPYVSVIVWDYARHDFLCHCVRCGWYFRTTPKKLSEKRIHCGCSNSPSRVDSCDVNLTSGIINDIAEAHAVYIETKRAKQKQLRHRRSGRAKEVEDDSIICPRIEVGETTVWFDQTPDGGWEARRGSSE